MYFPNNSHLVYPYDHKFWQNFVTRFHRNSLSLQMASWAQDSILSKSHLYYLIWTLTKPNNEVKETTSSKKLWADINTKKQDYEAKYFYFARRELNLLERSKKPFKWILLTNNKNLINKINSFSSKKILFSPTQNPIKLFD